MFRRKQKEVIRLFGIGGNLKTSIINSGAFKKYVKIPEFNREAGELLEPFKENISTAVNLVSKYIMVKTLLTTKERRFISDRSLIDYAIMNQLIINLLDHYFGASNENLTIERTLKLENDLYKDCKCYNILLVTKSEEFVAKIIDESWDERAYFYECSDNYFKSQEYYGRIIQESFPNVLVIELTDFSDFPKLIDSIVQKIKVYINE